MGESRYGDVSLIRIRSQESHTIFPTRALSCVSPTRANPNANVQVIYANTKQIAALLFIRFAKRQRAQPGAQGRKMRCAPSTVARHMGHGSARASTSSAHRMQ